MKWPLGCRRVGCALITSFDGHSVWRAVGVCRQRRSEWPPSKTLLSFWNKIAYIKMSIDVSAVTLNFSALGSTWSPITGEALSCAMTLTAISVTLHSANPKMNTALI